MSEIRVTNVIGENGSSPVNFTQGINMSGIVTATSFVPTVGQLSHRNLIINGAMQVAQRGTSSTSSGYHTTDRFRSDIGSISTTFTQSRQNLSSSDTGPWEKGFRNYKRIALAGAGSAAAGGYVEATAYRVEAQDLASSGWDYTSSSSYLTLQFWFRCSTNQTFYTAIRMDDGSARMFSFSFTASGNNTWTKVTKTIPGNSGITISNDNGIGMSIFIVPYYGTNFTANGTALDTWNTYNSNAHFPDMASTWLTAGASTFDITGVQLEVGSVATPFEHRSFADELNRCLRYCYVAGGAGPATDNYERFGTGWGYDSTRTRIQIFHPIPMRTAPTVSVPTIGDLQVSDSSNGYQCSAYERMGSVNGAMTTGIQFTHSSGVTAYRPMFVEARNTTAARIILSAEL